MTIRNYKSLDKSALLDIFKLNIPKYFDPSELADLEKYLQKHASTYYTVVQNTEIIGGFGFIINENQTGSITWIFFSPNHTGSGSGTKAVQFCHKHMREKFGVTNFSVRTSQHANLFFERFGYTTTHIENNYWGEGLDLYEMKCMVV